MPYTTLVSVETLAAHLDNADWIVCDCRHDLADTGAGRGAYSVSHIPGARFVHLDQDLSAPLTGGNGRHPLPDPDRLARRVGALGIGNGSQVVAYDASGGTYAARMWWMLRWLGHDAIAVLDGGWDAWVKGGMAVSASVPDLKPARFARVAALVRAVNAGEIAKELGSSRRRLVDARSPDRYRGENETLDPVAGHIPGAVNRFFRLNLDVDGRFKPAEALRREYSSTLGTVPPSHVTHYCGSGVSACHNLLAMEIAGLAGSSLYAGSWSEWVSDRSRPVATGNA